MIDEPCKIFAGAYTEGYAIVLFTDSSHVIELIDTHSPMVSDLFDKPEHQRVPADGLWMFEGRVVSVMPEDESRFTGHWRRPTDVEALAAAAGENPCMEPCGT